MLPTFSPEVRETHDARPFVVAVDSETTDADIRPLPGPLFHLGGIIQCEPLGFPVAVRLVSETGSRTAGTRCGESYSFDTLAPAGYEVYAETLDHQEAGFIELFVDRDSESGSVRAGRVPRVEAQYQRLGAGSMPTPSLTLLGRLQDLAETAADAELKLPQTLVKWNWEMRAKTGPNDYVDSIASFSGGSRRPWRPERSSDGCDLVISGFSTMLRVVVADTAGRIARNGAGGGRRRSRGSRSSYGRWRKRRGARCEGRCNFSPDVNGQFRFDGLPPGDYRLVASYDLTEVDEESIEAAQALVVHVDKSATVSADLAPWLAPY